MSPKTVSVNGTGMSIVLPPLAECPIEVNPYAAPSSRRVRTLEIDSVAGNPDRAAIVVDGRGALRSRLRAG
jgi:hypothetical protein